MFVVIDNFLSAEDFDSFSTIINKESTNQWNVRKLNPSSPNWTKYLYKSDYEDINAEFDKKYGPGISKISLLIESKIREHVDVLPALFSAGFMYSKYPYVIKPHFDNIYTDPNFIKPEFVTDSYSAFLYGHKTWDKDWGGILGFHKDFFIDRGKSNEFDKDNYYPIDPVPNRLVFYSLDEIHSVTPIINKNVIRQTFKMSFFKITKARRHPRSIESQIDHTAEF